MNASQSQSCGTRSKTSGSRKKTNVKPMNGCKPTMRAQAADRQIGQKGDHLLQYDQRRDLVVLQNGRLGRQVESIRRSCGNQQNPDLLVKNSQAGR